MHAYVWMSCFWTCTTWWRGRKVLGDKFRAWGWVHYLPSPWICVHPRPSRGGLLTQCADHHLESPLPSTAYRYPNHGNQPVVMVNLCCNTYCRLICKLLEWLTSLVPKLVVGHDSHVGSRYWGELIVGPLSVRLAQASTTSYKADWVCARGWGVCLHVDGISSVLVEDVDSIWADPGDPCLYTMDAWDQVQGQR